MLAVFGAIAAALVAVFALVALRSRDDVPLERVKAAAYRLRTPWLALLLVLLVAAVGTASFSLPYSSGKPPGAVVRVSGGQFYWSVSPRTVPAGEIRFEVSAVDVNHGLGIYAPGGELIGSVQAMPGYANRLDVELPRPGAYLLGCLEFCGVGHHEMNAELRVVD